MFNLSTQEVVLSIENAPVVKLNGLVYQEYNNFFGKNILEELANLDNLKFVKLEKQFDMPRQRVDYAEQLMKKMKIFFLQSTITNALQKKFHTSLTLDSVDLWQDNAGYYLTPHTDDTRIKLALQIYLGNDNQGTTLYDKAGKELYTFPFQENFGYALLNNEHSYHGVKEITENGRTSLYVRYS